MTPLAEPFIWGCENEVDGIRYRCTEVYDDGIRHPDGRWEPRRRVGGCRARRFD